MSRAGLMIGGAVGLAQRPDHRRAAGRVARLAQLDVKLHVDFLQGDQVELTFQEGAELLVAVVGLVERRVEAQHDLLQPAGEYRDFALLLGRDQRTAQQLARVRQLQLIGDVRPVPR